MRLMRTSATARHRFEQMAAEYLSRMGERIRARREELGLSRADVAREMPGKTNENAIYRWELGKHRPHDDALEALAQVLKVSTTYFMADAPDKSSTPDPFESTAGGAQLDRIEEAVLDISRRLAGLEKALTPPGATRPLEGLLGILPRLVLGPAEEEPPPTPARRSKDRRPPTA